MALFSRLLLSENFTSPGKGACINNYGILAREEQKSPKKKAVNISIFS